MDLSQFPCTALWSQWLLPHFAFKKNCPLQCHHWYWCIGLYLATNLIFVTYLSSKMKIKDLSSSNWVAEEGLIRCSLHNANGTVVIIELMGYHIPNTEVHFNSPQVFIWTLGGHALLNNQGMDISLDNGMVLSTNNCPHTNLPMVPLAFALSTSTRYCFGSDALLLHTGIQWNCWNQVCPQSEKFQPFFLSEGSYPVAPTIVECLYKLDLDTDAG